MPKYNLVLLASFEIEAENVVEAARAARRVRALGEHSGVRRPGRHDRDAIRHDVRLVDQDRYLFPERE